MPTPHSSEDNVKSCINMQSSIFSSCASVSESVNLSDEEFKTDLLRKKTKNEQKKKKKKDRKAIVSQLIKPLATLNLN